MKKIYLVRHGETDANASSVVQGSNNELSALGRKQAEVLAERLRHLDFTNVLVSDYVRTRQTAEALLHYCAVTPEYSALVREVKRPTQFIGTPRYSEQFLQYEETAAEQVADPHWHFADEENFYDVIARIKDFFAHIDTFEGDTVVITHGRFIIMTMMYVVTGGKLTPDLWNGNLSTFHTTNTGITVLSYKEHKNLWSLTTYNDHAHFAE